MKILKKIESILTILDYKVKLTLPYNRNKVGTAFGGTISVFLIILTFILS